MKRILLLFVSIIFVASNAYADCRGCCNGHGGIVCDEGITKCVDGTALSAKCLSKKCNICSDTVPSANTEVTIKIASFNIQVFGRSKASKPEVMEVLSKIISQFDVVAIQEIRDKSGKAIKDLEVAVDDLGENYDFIIGPRLGRSNSKEQYAYIYRVKTILPGDSYTYQEVGGDAIHREPFIAQFFSKQGDFDFVLITSHVDPDDVDQELAVFPKIVADAKSRFPGETDVMILGDLNADCTYFDEDQQIALRDPGEYNWLITNEMDTNVAGSSCAYDRIIITDSMNAKFTGDAGVVRFDEIYELDCEPKKVSDHYPVYGVFRVE